MRRKIGVLLFIGLFVASGWLLLFRTAWENRPVPADARQLIRFHVLANSDREEDQQVKLKVRDAVVSYLAQIGRASCRERV
jgi:stage II sporulation protein R